MGRDVLGVIWGDWSQNSKAWDTWYFQALAGGGIMSDKCNGAQKQKSLLNDEVAKASPDGIVAATDHCYNHLQNIWFSAAMKALSKYLSDFLKYHLDKISPHKRFVAQWKLLFEYHTRGPACVKFTPRALVKKSNHTARVWISARCCSQRNMCYILESTILCWIFRFR